MKRIFTLFLCVFINLGTYAQITFNHRLDFNSTNAVLTSILPTDSCYYATGIIADTIPPYLTGNLFVKFSLEGEVLFSKWLVDSLNTYQTWQGTLTFNAKDELLVTGYTGSPTTPATGVVFFFTEQGDTIKTIRYVSPFLPEDQFMVPVDMKIDADSNLVIYSNIHDPSYPSNAGHFIKFSQEGELLAEQTYTGPIDRSARSIFNYAEGGYLVGGMITTYENSPIDEYTRIHLTQLDEDGNINWEYKSPTDKWRRAASDIIQLKDGGLVMSTGLGYDYFGQTRWHPMLLKLDYNQNIEWEITFEEEQGTPNSRIRRIFQTEDGGFIAGGHLWDVNDSSSEEDLWDFVAFMWKVSETGDSLWSRYYQIVHNKTDFHYIQDIERCPDGGYVFVGEAQDEDPEEGEPSQQAWIFKVDEYGCLIPGCQLLDDVEEPPHEKVQYQVYPNPVSDWLSVYVNDSSISHLNLVDAQGRLLQSTQAQRAQTTYLISVQDYPPGIYFLQGYSAQELLFSEKIIIQH